MTKTIKIALLLASVSAVAACSKKAPEQLPPAPAQTTRAEAPMPPATTRPAGPQVGSQQHFVDAVGQENTVENACETNQHYY